MLTMPMPNSKKTTRLRKNSQVKQILVFWVVDKNTVDFLLHANKLDDVLAVKCQIPGANYAVVIDQINAQP